MDRSKLYGTLLKRSLLFRVEERFTDLNHLAILTEQTIRERRAKTQADAFIEEAIKKREFEDWEIERYQDEIRQLTDDFPQLLRTSSLAATQAALESFLLHIARVYAKATMGTYDAAVWQKGRGRIWGVKKYLEEIHGKVNLGHHWDKVSDYVNVRNAIAHGDGSITDDLKDRRASEAAAVRLKPHVKLMYPAESKKLAGIKIELDAEAVEDFIYAAQQLCTDLLKPDRAA